MHCRIRPAVGASVSLSKEQPLLFAQLARMEVGGEAPHGTQTLPGRAREAEGGGSVSWSVGDRTGKPVCAADVCGVLAGLCCVCLSPHAEVQGGGFSLWPSHCWADPNFPTCKRQIFAASASLPSHGFAFPWHTGSSWALRPGSCGSHHPLAHLQTSSVLAVLLVFFFILLYNESCYFFSFCLFSLYLLAP